MKTFLPKVQDIKREWHQVDASKFTLGRLASTIASILRGKHKVTFTPHMDVGDFVVVINAAKVKITGKKLDQKMYHHFSGFPGGITTKTLRERMEKEPEQVIKDAVYNMVDDNRLRKQILRRLKVVAGDSHEFQVDKEIA
ncbi:MAG: 50S ribosomal protein L13 [bacterium]|nr:50S ribosomal protein L13 [bacterium]